MKLSTSLTTTLVTVSVMAVAAVGLILDRSLESSLLPRELERVRVSTRQLALELGSLVLQAKSDLLTMRGSTAIDGIIRARLARGRDPREGVSEAVQRDRLASLFTALLVAKPYYLQARLIGIADGGRELVRVDRTEPAGPTRTVPPRQLQRKGDRGYFVDSVGLPPERLYVSPIELNRENGSVMVPHTPVIRVATPIPDAGGKIFAILVLNVDLRQELERLRASASPAEAIYLVNQSGEYLLHPDRSREFGFDLGARFRFQDEFPKISGDLDWRDDSIIETRDRSGRRLHVIVSPVELDADHRVALIKTIPHAAILAVLSPLRQSIYWVGLGVALFAAVVALALAKTLTKPLQRMTAAVEAFRLDQPTEIPRRAGGEIGVLARAFDRMSNQVRQKTEALEHEIEQRRRAEQEAEQLAGRERLFAAVVDSSLDAVLTKTLDGIITGWNPAAERLYGYSTEEAVGKAIDLIVPEDRRSELGEILARVGRGDRVEVPETVRVDKRGRRIEVSLTVSPVRSASGEIMGASAIAHDIGLRKKDEEMFRMAVESSPSGMVMSEADGTIVMVNAETEHLFGYSREELVGESVEILVPVRFRPQHVNHRAGYLKSPRVRAMGAGRDLHGLRKDGSEFPIEIGLNPIETRDGLRILSAIVDITERKAIEAALAEQTRELQRSNKELEQFAYVASHDLQEPLRMVASYTELLADRYRGNLDERADKYIGYIVDGAHRMQRLINDLLAYSRVGTRCLELNPTDTGEVLRQTLHQLKTLIDETGAEISAGSLPVVDADETQLGQVFQNLIGNAIKFRGEEAPRVRVEAEKNSGEWLFSVRDNGIGIDKRHSARLFQMFQRLHQRDKYEGNGIGLAITRKIVERHRGRIWFDSELGKGSTFYFTIRGD